MVEEQNKGVEKIELGNKEEEEKDESYTDLFGKWARDKLRTSKRKIKDIE